MLYFLNQGVADMKILMLSYGLFEKALLQVSSTLAIWHDLLLLLLLLFMMIQW